MAEATAGSREDLSLLRAAVDDALPRYLPSLESMSTPVHEAARYALLGSGKRLRPMLLLAAGEALGARRDDLLPAACAVEMVHAFSLVHDDLPALDDDTLRRGRPTVHVRFGEAMAILAGDALLNLAFDTMARHPASAEFAPKKLAAIRTLTSAVGLAGMIAGQALDLEFEGRQATEEELESIHLHKTGALITASCQIGGILAGAGEPSLEMLGRYGRSLGLAFQITDDILDIEGTASAIGKSPGKDAQASKATFPSVWGVDASREMAARCIREAMAALDPLGAKAAMLHTIARVVADRRR
jgi:farnesyl diphosphate synthase